MLLTAAKLKKKYKLKKKKMQNDRVQAEVPLFATNVYRGMLKKSLENEKGSKWVND